MAKKVKKKKVKLALQTWTVKQNLQQKHGASRILKKIKGIGYNNLELGGIGLLRPKEFKALCKENKLNVVGLHEGILTRTNIDSLCKEIYKRCGIFNAKQATVCFNVQGYSQYDREAYTEYANLCSKAGAKLRELGISLNYHCYDFDIKSIEDNISGLDIILDNTSSEDISIQLDTYFIYKAECDPFRIIDKCRKRCKLVHLDDINNEKKHAPLGKGIIKWQKIFDAFLKNCSIEYFIIEHKVTEGRVEDWIAESFRYFQEDVKLA